MLLLGLLTLLLATPATAARSAVDPAQPTPLIVKLTAMTPAIPPKGKVVLRGVVMNASDEVWRDINVAPFISDKPMTTRAELVAAAAAPETSDAGHRLTSSGTFTSIGDLDPGETKPFVIRLKRDQLPISGERGVYWIGAHALGLNHEGRDGIADGRARTFIPLVARTGEKTTTKAKVALVVQLRQPVRRAADGRIVDGDAWADALGDEGRLGRILRLAEAAPSATYTWLIDPAVLDAAQSIADGNPKLSYGKANPSPSPSPSPGATASNASFHITRDSKADATGWLDRLTSVAQPRTVLGLPYADPDVAGLARLRPALLKSALDLAAARFKARAISDIPAYAPPSGWVSQLLWSSQHVPVILASDHGEDMVHTRVQVPDGAHVIFTDERAASGGPLPNPATAALAMRQRILSEAALRVVQGVKGPLVVMLPEYWNPGPNSLSSGFFTGLERPWLSLVGLDPTGSTGGPLPLETALPYPPTEQKAEINGADVHAASDLVAAGATLAAVLDTDNDVTDDLLGDALAATSYAARTDSELPRLVEARASALQHQLASVRVLGTEFNTLSGGSGRLTVTVVNELPQPVKLGLSVIGGPGLRVSPPPDILQIGPRQRQTVRLQAVADRIGVHEVTLTPVTTKGDTFGTPLKMTVRTSQVGRLVWIVLGAGAGLFVVMIIRRIVQRIRSHRWKPADS